MKKKSLCADDLLKETIEQYSPFVYRLAYSLVKSRSDADDIHQEVFITYIKKRPDFENEEHKKAWFIRVTVNLCKNWQKSAWRRKMVSLTEFGDDWEEGSGNNMIEVICEERISEEAASLINTVKKLPQKYRSVIHLFYYEEMSVEEISRAMQQKPSTVRTQLTRARRKLSEMLKEEI